MSELIWVFLQWLFQVWAWTFAVPEIDAAMEALVAEITATVARAALVCGTLGLLWIVFVVWIFWRRVPWSNIHDRPEPRPDTLSER